MRPSQLTATTVVGWLDAGRRVVAGLLVEIEGSAPLEPGATVYVDADGAIEGNVTGGCVESAVVHEALELMATDGPARLVTYGISDELAGTAGLMCGGVVRILVHELTGDARDAARLGLESVLAERSSAVATLLDGPAAGAKLFVDTWSRTGGLGGPALLDDNVEREARGLMAQGQTAVRTFGAEGAVLGSDLRVHISAFVEPPQMLIAGAIDYSVALARIAQALGYRVVICDPRRSFLESARFGAYAETIAAWPAKVIADAAPGPRDAVLVFSHDARIDVPALIAAFATEAGYVGALGSRRTTADRERRLRAAGAGDDDLARLFAPCGLAIGAATVEESAVSVMAEIVAERTRTAAVSLRDVDGPIHPARLPADSGARAR